jgi:hypothetical protein
MSLGAAYRSQHWDRHLNRRNIFKQNRSTALAEVASACGVSSLAPGVLETSSQPARNGQLSFCIFA